MSGRMNINNELIEEVMEAVSFYKNFAGDLEKVLSLIDENEKLDHINDTERTEIIGFLVTAKDLYKMRSYDRMETFVDVALQKLHKQERDDLKDDESRTKAKMELSLLREKALHNQDKLTELIGRIRDAAKQS